MLSHPSHPSHRTHGWETAEDHAGGVVPQSRLLYVVSLTVVVVVVVPLTNEGVGVGVVDDEDDALALALSALHVLQLYLTLPCTQPLQCLQ